VPFGWYSVNFANPYQPEEPIPHLDVADTLYPHYAEPTRSNASPGRRIRAFANMPTAARPPQISLGETALTWGQVLARVDTDPSLSQFRQNLDSLPLRIGPQVLYTEIPEGGGRAPSDASLHVGLQDLGYQINDDVSKACAAFNNPDLFYPGVDEVEPVDDEHVKLVIWALNRELHRELRQGKDGKVLPAVPLSELPWRIQRALVERRRFRYQQWGITRKNWEDGSWSLWNVPINEDWVPSWVV